MTDTAPGANAPLNIAATIPKTLIDLHCHVFNATDLPVSEFIFRVVRQRYNADPDGLVLGLGAILSALAGNAPTATAELADIHDGRASPSAATSPRRSAQTESWTGSNYLAIPAAS